MKKKHDHGKMELPESEEVGNSSQLMADDIISSQDLVDFPKIKDESPRNQSLMCAYACGYSTRFIAESFNISQPTVFNIIKRIDPTGAFRISPDGKKAFLTRICESRAMEAMGSITPEDYRNSTGVEKARIADISIKISQSLNQTKHKSISVSRLDSIIDSTIEADAVVISESPIKEGE
jgi:hypothetical protein